MSRRKIDWTLLFLIATAIAMPLVKFLDEVRSDRDGNEVRYATPKDIPTAKEVEEADRQADRSGGGMVEGEQAEVP
jgi:hypothetical protein